MSDIVGVSEDSDLRESESGFEGSRKLRDGGQRLLPEEALAGTTCRSTVGLSRKCSCALGLALRGENCMQIAELK